jgi:hypothetical protein
MESPSQRLFEEDVRSAEFRIGEVKGYWGFPTPEALPDVPAWPKRVLWITPAARPNAPERFHIRVDLEGYRSAAPTSTFWDLARNEQLALDKWPKGKDGSRFAKVFRTTDWKKGAAFYHPYDRVAASDHPQWLQQQPHLVWTPEHTIVHYLEEFHSLLQGNDYRGV